VPHVGVSAAMLASRLWLSSSLKMTKKATTSRSTSRGLRSGPPAPLRVMMMGPMSPVKRSNSPSAIDWYVHTTLLGSAGPGPARSGTFQLYTKVVCGSMASSNLFTPSAAPSDMAPESRDHSSRRRREPSS
jgi:hypothetical protein